MVRQHHIPFAGFLLAGLALFVALASWGRAAYGAVPAGCTELVQDGGFEGGGLVWQQSSAGDYDLISDYNPRTGELGAYLAGIDNADDRLSQQVVLPAGASTLRAWWSMATSEDDAEAFDKMTVSLRRPDGSLVADLVTLDNTDPAYAWEEIAINLTPYAGQTVILQFAATTDGTNITDFYLDDISVVVCGMDSRIYLPFIIR